MPSPSQVVIFGASGDLALRKLLPALASLSSKAQPAEGFSVIGVSRREKSDEAFRAEVGEAMPPELEAAWAQLSPRVHYVAGDVGSVQDLDRLSVKLDALPGGRATGRLFYLSLKPDLFANAISNLASKGLVNVAEGERTAWRRVVVEKPFGHDLASALALNRHVQPSPVGRAAALRTQHANWFDAEASEGQAGAKRLAVLLLRERPLQERPPWAAARRTASTIGSR